LAPRRAGDRKQDRQARRSVAHPGRGGRHFVRDHGSEAYSEARLSERDVILPNETTHAGRTPGHWRRVALIVARMMGKRVGVDPATRMLERGGE